MVGLPHSGCGSGQKQAILNGLKAGWVNWVTWVWGRIRLAHIFHIKKTTNKCQIFRENESNQIVRLFVTNLLLWEKHKQTKKHKDFHILAIQIVLTFEHN